MQKITPFLWFAAKQECISQSKMAAMMQMTKLDIAGLRRAAEG
ncbi:MAG: hypothetical protein ABI383_10015 [Acidobacteriaceae bacterium]